MTSNTTTTRACLYQSVSNNLVNFKTISNAILWQIADTPTNRPNVLFLLRNIWQYIYSLFFIFKNIGYLIWAIYSNEADKKTLNEILFILFDLNYLNKFIWISLAMIFSVFISFLQIARPNHFHHHKTLSSATLIHTILINFSFFLSKQKSTIFLFFCPCCNLV